MHKYNFPIYHLHKPCYKIINVNIQLLMAILIKLFHKIKEIILKYEGLIKTLKNKKKS